MGFNALLYEGFVPGQVADNTALASRALFCGEHDAVVVAIKRSINLQRQVAALLARYIYWHTQWGQSVQVHEQVVYQIAYASVVAVAQLLAVGPTEGVVAHKCETAAVGIVGQIVVTLNVEFVVKIVHHGIKPRHALHVAHALHKIVYFVLMHNMLETRHYKTWYIACLAAGLVLEHLVYVYLKYFILIHNRRLSSFALQMYKFIFAVTLYPCKVFMTPGTPVDFGLPFCAHARCMRNFLSRGAGMP